MKDFKENLQKCQSYIQALEEERRKIQVFQRELPLCLELVTQAIDACKQQLSGASNEINTREYSNNNRHNNNSDCTSDEGPVFEEFIPLKRSHCSDDDDDHHEMSDDRINHHDDHDDVDKSEEKSDWLRSVQLWNQTPDPPTSYQMQEHQPKRLPVVEVTNSPQQNIEKQERSTSCDVKNATVEPVNSTCTDAKAAAVVRPEGNSGSGGGGTKREEKGGRKARRCWSPELHKRFLHALQQLGGSHAATPKQIRELMKVDGLTNDEVKSHLQKYRLHTRRSPTSTTTNNNSNDQQSHQFVVVGGIWMPPSEFNSMASIATNSRETSPKSAPDSIYAPIATMASPSSNSQRKQHQQASQSHEERGSHSHGGVHSNSTSTSSSTHTTTTSRSH